MIARTWVGPTIGLVVSLLLYFLLVPIVPVPLSTVLGIVLIIGIVVCAILLVASFIRSI